MKKIMLLILLSFTCLCCISCSNNSGATDSGSKINYTNYNKIENGMSYDEVCEILGEEGVSQSSYDVVGYSVDIFVWQYKSFSNYRIITVTFHNKRVFSKSQSGLDL